MIALHNGCWISEPTVNPKNWLTQNASTKKDWYIQYYFHDPTFQDHPSLKNGKLRIVKGMNGERNPAERRRITKAIISEELALLQEEGYNPITKQYYRPEAINYEIDPSTPFTKALKQAFARLQTSKVNTYCIKSCLKYVCQAAEQLRFDLLEVQAVRRRHVKLILEQCKRNRPEYWSNQNYNHYRAYLMMLFKELLELDAIEQNPVTDLPKMQVERKIRPTLSGDQRILIDNHLRRYDPDFRRYIHIFFHSGSRIAELSKLQGKDVDLVNQRFKITVKKGKNIRQEWRPIKNIAVDFWREVLEHCDPEYYVFSRGVRPGKDPVLNEYITKRWRKIIKCAVNKGGLGIDIDFYSLKHLNLDETAAEIADMQEGIIAAASMAGHTTPVITLRYAQGERERQNERLKKIGNKFA